MHSEPSTTETIEAYAWAWLSVRQWASVHASLLAAVRDGQIEPWLRARGFSPDGRTSLRPWWRGRVWRRHGWSLHYLDAAVSLAAADDVARHLRGRGWLALPDGARISHPTHAGLQWAAQIDRALRTPQVEA